MKDRDVKGLTYEELRDRAAALLRERLSDDITNSAAVVVRVDREASRPKEGVVVLKFEGAFVPPVEE